MKQNIDITELQEQHLDTMIKLAFDMDDAENVQRLVEEPDPVLTQDEELFTDDILRKVLTDAEKQEKKKRNQRFFSATRAAFPRILQVAASLVIALALATPIALAASAEFRAKVMELLIQIDADHGEVRFQFVENTSESFTVPELWIGEYFPSYIPDGFEVTQVIEPFVLIEYQSGDQQKLSFSESTEEVSGNAGTDNATITEIDINGATGYVIDGSTRNGTVHAVTITWAIDDRWFSVVTKNVETDEAIRIARSVKKIIK